MNGRLFAALLAVVLLGGGSVVFVLWRAAAEREQQVDDIVAEVRTELDGSSATTDPEVLRLLLRRASRAREETPDARLDVAAARLLLALGRSQEAWDLVRPLATAPGAAAGPLEIGARILERVHAESGDDGAGRQALALAEEHARRTDSAASLRLAWQLAHRVGDPMAFGALSARVVERAAPPDPDLVRSTVAVLAGFLADRLGLPRDLLQAGADGAAGALGAAQTLAAEAVTVAALDDLGARYPEPPVELELVAAYRQLDRFGAIQGEPDRRSEAEDLLADARRRIDAVLARTPSNVDARNLAVFALFGMQQVFGLDADAATRYRGHLQWLLSTAPQTHVQRPVWQQLLDRLGR